MTAKELKIRTMKLQRETIEALLNEADDATCAFSGMIYPEVQKYFEEAGFEVLEVRSEKLLVENGGFPTFLITAANVKLTPEEKTSAEIEHTGLISGFDFDLYQDDE